MPTRINIQVEDDGRVVVMLDPPQATQRFAAGSLAATNFKGCCICGDKLAYNSIHPTSGHCYTAGMAAKAKRQEGAASGGSADNPVPLESVAPGPPAIAGP